MLDAYGLVVRRRLVAFVLLAACKGGSSSPATPDASVDAPAPPDAAQQEVSFYGCDGGAITSIALPGVRVGQSVEYTVRFGPPFAVASAVSNDPDLQAYTLDNNLALTFAPTAVGHHEATVTVTTTAPHSNVSAIGRLTLTVDALAASTSPLVVSASLVQGGTTVVLKNQSTSAAVDLYAATVTMDDGSPAVVGPRLDACPRTLFPGDTCTTSIEPTSRTLGCHRMTVTFHGSSNDDTMYVDEALASVLVDLTSPYGTISVDPPSSCNAGQCVAGPVTLTATANATGRFVGWLAGTGCGTDPTCVFRPFSASPGVATSFGAVARFAPSTAKTISVTVQGSGRGRVVLYEDDANAVACDGSCTLAATGSVQLVAATGSRFTGWSGACTGQIPQCNLGVLGADVTVGATFDADDRELAAFATPVFDLDQFAGVAGGALPGGDFVVAAWSRVSRITAAGAVAWTRADSAADLVTSPSGDIYYLGFSGATLILYKLDSGGTVAWSRPLYHPPDAFPCDGLSQLAVTGSGDVAVISNQTVRVVSSATGADVWTAAAPQCHAVAAGPMGNVVVAVHDETDTTVARLERYDATGARQLPDWTLDQAAALDLKFDAQGFLVVRTGNATLPSATLVKLSPTGVPAFSVTENGAGSGYDIAVAIASNGEIVTADALDNDSGVRLRRWSATGAVTWTLDKPAFTSTLGSSGLFSIRPVTDASGRVLALGSFVAGNARSWAQLYASP
jgi:hypothetical protein